MPPKGTYKTKQQQRIVDYLAALNGGHATAGEIASHLRAAGPGVGISTVYRQLDKLVQAGIIKRYELGAAAGACYQYVSADGACGEHFHLKCEGCGTLIHLDCEHVRKMQAHLHESHGFLVNGAKTVLYGHCGKCAKEN